MELLMKNVHMCRQSKKAEVLITLEEDLNVPDICPDVEQIIQCRERILIEHTRSENNRFLTDGYMTVNILYMDDTKNRQLHRLETKIPFEEAITMEGLEAGDSVNLRYETEDLNVSLINSRKLAIRALLTIRASVEEIYDLSAAVETQADYEVCEKKKKLELMQLEIQKKDILRVKEEVQVPSNKPNISEILWENITLRGCRLNLEDGQLRVKGSLFLFVLYRADDESGSIQWMEQTLPVDGIVDCGGCSPDLVPDITVSLAQTDLSVKEDADGELRLFHLESVLDLEIQLYGYDTVELLEDVFSPEQKLELTVSSEEYETLVIKNESKCKTTGKIRIQGAKPRILQICHSTGAVKIDNTEMTEAGLKIEGAIPVSILYISSDDSMPFALMEGAIPFSHLAEVSDMDRNCRYSMTAGLDQLSATMSDSEEIEVRASVNISLFVVRKAHQQCIHEIHEKAYTLEELESVPGITGYIVQEGDCLWNIAKEYYLTPAQILEMNNLEREQIHPGDCLILMKNVKIPQNH